MKEKIKKIIFPFFNNEHCSFLLKKWNFRIFFILYGIALIIVSLLVFINYVDSASSWCYDSLSLYYDDISNFTSHLEECSNLAREAWFPGIGFSIVVVLILHYLINFLGYLLKRYYKIALQYMSKILEQINKLSLPAVILIASIILGGFYYVNETNKQRSIERQQQIKIDQEKQEQLAKELKGQRVKEEAEQALNACIADAEESYLNQWRRECKSQGLLTNRCISLNEMTFEEYVKQNNIPTGKERLDALIDFSKKRDDCACRLSSYYADDLDKNLQNNKDQCFKKYPQK